MPIYEYKCQQCGTHFEKRQNVSDAPLTTCEKCHGRLEKQWSLSGFQFKGAGWYVTDYSGKKGSEKGEKSSAAESTGKSDTASNSTGEKAAASTSEKVSKKE
jgi:putative FmdB family regulatory protein